MASARSEAGAVPRASPAAARSGEGAEAAEAPRASLGVVGIVGFALLYYVSALLGRWTSPGDTTYVAFWIPAGVYVAVLLLHETRLWPRVMLGALLGNFAFDVPAGTSLGLFAGFYLANVVTCVGGAWLVRRFIARRPTLGSLKEYFGVAILAGLLSSMAGAAVGTLTLALAGLADDVFHSWQLWWGSTGMAIVLITPVLLTWTVRDARGARLLRERRAEALTILVAIAAIVSYLMVSGQGLAATYRDWLLPLMVWAGVRLGIRGATAAALLLAVLIASFTGAQPPGVSAPALTSGDFTFTMQSFLFAACVVAHVPAILLGRYDRVLDRLRDSEERLRDLADATFEGIVICDSGTIIDANDQTLGLLRCQRSELLGTALASWFAPGADAARRGGSPRDGTTEQTLRRGDAGEIVVEMQSRLARAGDREMQVVALRDLTARRTMEAALEHEHVRMEVIVNSAMDGIITIDEARRIVVFNHAAERMFRCPAGEVLGTPIDRFLPWPIERGAPAPLRAFVESGLPTRAFAASADLRGRRADGEEFPLEASLSRVELASQQLVTMTCRDVTERVSEERAKHQLEELLRQSQKIEAIGTLAGGIAHDFNNILTVIMINAQLASKDNPGNARLLENLGQVTKASQRAQALVRQILAFSRTQPHERRPTALAPLVREALAMLRSTLPSTIEFDIDVDPDLPGILGDETQMHQLVVNLCTNASHAMGGQPGRLSVTLTACPPEEAVAARPGLPVRDYVVLSIRDTGCGMTETTRQRIFDPFFTTKPKGEGTGLGLWVVQGIIHAHEGAITVESTVGAGTTLRVYLPTTTAAASPPPTPHAAAPRGRGERILFVDDEVAIGRVARRVFEEAGYQVTVFEHPQAAWEAFARAPDAFDLLVTDLTMPGLTGVELATKVLALRPALPILLTTGYSQGLDAEAVRAAGIRALVLKPLSPWTLLQQVARCFDGAALTRT